MSSDRDTITIPCRVVWLWKRGLHRCRRQAQVAPTDRVGRQSPVRGKSVAAMRPGQVGLGAKVARLIRDGLAELLDCRRLRCLTFTVPDHGLHETHRQSQIRRVQGKAGGCQSRNPRVDSCDLWRAEKQIVGREVKDRGDADEGREIGFTGTANVVAIAPLRQACASGDLGVGQFQLTGAIPEAMRQRLHGNKLFLSAPHRPCTLRSHETRRSVLNPRPAEGGTQMRTVVAAAILFSLSAPVVEAQGFSPGGFAAGLSQGLANGQAIRSRALERRRQQLCDKALENYVNSGGPPPPEMCNVTSSLPARSRFDEPPEIAPVTSAAPQPPLAATSSMDCTTDTFGRHCTTITPGRPLTFTNCTTDTFGEHCTTN